MPLLVVVLISVVAVSVAYAIYAPLLVRLFRLDANAPTPAVLQRDDVDFVPPSRSFS